MTKKPNIMSQILKVTLSSESDFIQDNTMKELKRTKLFF
jgi:hypothetical protein